MERQCGNHSLTYALARTSPPPSPSPPPSRTLPVTLPRSLAPSPFRISSLPFLWKNNIGRVARADPYDYGTDDKWWKEHGGYQPNEGYDKKDSGLDQEVQEDAKKCDESMHGGSGALYRGCQSKTRSGKTCQNWKEQTPNGMSDGESASPPRPPLLPRTPLASMMMVPIDTRLTPLPLSLCFPPVLSTAT